MSTSLADQLKRLAVPQSSVLKRDKKRYSLLFDPKEAATLSRETVFQIGLDGFEELVRKNPVFEQFQNTLFDISSKEFERSVQTSEVNDKLNKNIKKFLILLSPYFSLNCTHKTLEWLVYRFYIHQYNKEDLLALILPYHQTNVFVRALQLIELRDPTDKWYWLQPLQKPGIHMPKNMLYNHAASDAEFLKFISKCVLSAIKQHPNPNILTVTFNYYCSVYAGALEYSSKITETQLAQILPSLLKGLNSEIPDFAAATYIIAAKLLLKVELSEKILNKFVDRLCDNKIPNLKSEAVLVMIILYQTQKQFNEISDVALQHLVANPWIIKCVNEHHNKGYNVYPLLSAIFENLLKTICKQEGNEDYINFAENVFAQMKFNQDFASKVVDFILDTYRPKPKTNNNSHIILKRLLNKIETQYPTYFDHKVRLIMKFPEDELASRRQKTFSKILTSTNVMKDIFGAFEKIYHPSKEIRIQGVRYLVDKYEHFQQRDKNMLRNAILDRIDDDNVEVVLVTLKSFKSKLVDIIEPEVLKSVLLKLLKAPFKKIDISWSLFGAVLEILCQNFCFDYDTFLAILPFLFPLNPDEFRATRIITNSPISDTHPFLENLRNKTESCQTHADYMSSVEENLTSLTTNLDIDQIISKLTQKDPPELDSAQKYLIVNILTARLENEPCQENAFKILEVFTKYIENEKLTSLKTEPNLHNCVSMSRRNKFPLQGVFMNAENLILATPKLYYFRLHDFSQNNTQNSFFATFLRLLFQKSSSKKRQNAQTFSELLKKFFSHICSNPAQTIEMCANLAMADLETIDDAARIRCLRNVQELYAKIIETHHSLLNRDSLFVPYLLIGLSCENKEIRTCCLNIIKKSISSSTGTDSESYFDFLRKVYEFQSEIAIDSEQIPQVFQKLHEDGTCTSVFDLLSNIKSDGQLPRYLNAGLFKALSQINDFDYLEKGSKLVLDVLDLAKTQNKFDNSQSIIIRTCLSQLNGDVAKNIEIESEVLRLIQSALRCDKNAVRSGNDFEESPAFLVLNQLERNVFDELGPEVQNKIIEEVINLATETQNPDVLQVAGRFFKHIDLDSNFITSQLTLMKNAESPKLAQAKKKRLSVVPTVDILDTDAWKRGVTILEFIQDKKKIRNSNLLLPLLFDILKKCLDFDEQNTVEYVKQLLLSGITHICFKFENHKISESVFNVELVVQCIRASSNPQTHHHALLLLAKAAELVPKQVLHHMIAVFTFIGSSVLRHDDSYSFQIITKIIDTIIPILVEDKDTQNVTDVLRVFVDAILDVPEHRRTPLYKLLLNRVDPKENLSLFLLLVFEGHVIRGQTDRKTVIHRNDHAEETPKRLEVATTLCREFSSDTILTSFIKLMQYLRRLPEEKSDTAIHNRSQNPHDIRFHTPKHFRHFKYTIVTFVSKFLSSKEFVEQIASLSDEDLQELEPLFKDMIINTLTYIQTTSKVVDKNRETPQAQYWKIMLHYSYDALDSLNSLLTPQMFVLVMKGLMVHSFNTVKRRSLELLNNKLQNNPEFFDDFEVSELLSIMTPLVNIIRTVEEGDLSMDQEIIVQTSLLSLKLLVRLLALHNPDKFAQILDFITDLLKLGEIDGNVLASIILCLAELCTNLRAHSISSMPKFMPVLIKVLKTHKKLLDPSLLLLSALTALLKIIEALALFLSPYLEKLLTELCSLISIWDLDNKDQKLLPFTSKLIALKNNLGQMIPPRVLIPAVAGCYGSLAEKEAYEAIGPVMAVLGENLNNMKGPEVQANLPQLLEFFLKALQLRADNVISFEKVNDVENHVVKALVTLVLKLSESNFRPIYYKLFDWAVRSEEKTERVITFYNISSGIANSLKGLFVLFAGHFINNAANLLDACNKSKNEQLYYGEQQKNVFLSERVLETLLAVFSNDSNNFINKERFEVLLSPLVDQLENELGGKEAFLERVTKLITPCIVYFGVCSGDDTMWKQVNYQVLVKTRSNSPTVRLASLGCLKEFAKKLGEDFLPLLPETIPFLAELLEDEEEEVEGACRKVVQDLEKIFGESLQRYF